MTQKHTLSVDMFKHRLPNRVEFYKEATLKSQCTMNMFKSYF